MGRARDGIGFNAIYTARMLGRICTCIWAVALLAAISVPASAQDSRADGWPEYGGNLAGQRYSAADQIKPDNVGALQLAWTFHTHALTEVSSPLNKHALFEATPVLWNGTLYFDSPFDEVFAVDAATGKLKWRFDPEVNRNKDIYIVAARGVALWHSSKAHPETCSDRVFVATLDKRLIALDATTGKPCKDFGDAGTVDLSQGIYISEQWLLEYTSPPVVVGDRIVLGSSVGDNQTINSPSGEVRGFDAHSGHQVWSWQPVAWAGAVKEHTSGSGNAWAPLAADAEHDLVFVPTGSAALDYYGGLRVGDNRDADSLVALRASTGQKVWAFQLVHHDLWDYDTASQPLLFTFRGTIPAVAITNKTGMIYVFNRLTGEPLYPIVERPVPKSELKGEVTWPTQPFSTLPPLQPLRYSVADLRGSAADRQFCAAEIDKLKYQGLFTPPSEQGSLIYPSALGGPNWGSSAFDPQTGVMYTRVNSMPYRLQMISKTLPPPKLTLWQRVVRKWTGQQPVLPPPPPLDPLAGNAYRPPDLGQGPVDGSIMRGSPYRMSLQAIVSPGGVPCGPAPYGRIVATNLDTGRQLWSVAHGTMVPGGPGSVGVGGALVTAGRLVFAASTNDPFLRAYDAGSGKELWKGPLPATANATPMTYELRGRQFVVIAVGGNRLAKGDESDSVLAFTLRRSSAR
jgi:quinoprotein glucose dehydrogenase